jgi:hypothetical protein
LILHGKENRKGTGKYKYISKRKKLAEGMEAASHNEGMSVDNESSIMSSNAFSKTGEQKEVFYKLATP